MVASSPEDADRDPVFLTSGRCRDTDVTGGFLLEFPLGLLGEEIVGDAAVLGLPFGEDARESSAEDEIRDLRPLLVVGIEEHADVGLGECACFPRSRSHPESGCILNRLPRNPRYFSVNSWMIVNISYDRYLSSRTVV